MKTFPFYKQPADTGHAHVSFLSMLMQIAVNNAMQATDIEMLHQFDASCINHAFVCGFKILLYNKGCNGIVFNTSHFKKK